MVTTGFLIFLMAGYWIGLVGEILCVKLSLLPSIYITTITISINITTIYSIAIYLYIFSFSFGDSGRSSAFASANDSSDTQVYLIFDTYVRP